VKPIVLILCIGNSCRSQIGEGLLRVAAGDLVEVRSAGSKPTGTVHPRAIQVMQEIGIDLSGHRSKQVSEFHGQEIATLITVCGDADDACPTFPGKATRHHWPFADPAHAQGSDAEILQEFRRVRDEMKRVFDAYAAGLREGRTFA
jgi:arsenate reductase (thioredoxin)